MGFEAWPRAWRASRLASWPIPNIAPHSRQLAQRRPSAAHTRRDKTYPRRAARAEGRCEIDLIDHGPGVRENLRARLFEPFVSAAPEAGGTGLGLAISRELARAMGGELELVRNGAEGATFRITLPAA